MPITDKQREDRKNASGASDVSAVAGMNPWKSGYEAWAEKCGLIEPAPTSEAAEIGTMHERAVLDWAESKLGKLRRNPNNVRRSVPSLHLKAHLDAIVIAGGNPVEAKTAGIVNPMYVGEEWGEPGTDEVPPYVLIQAQAQLICTGKEVCHVAALIAGRGHQMFNVHRNNELVLLIQDLLRKFWQHVESRTPWNVGVIQPDVWKRIKRVPKSIATLDADLVAEWNRAKDVLDVAKSNEELAKSKVLRSLGTAEAGDFGSDEEVVTFFEQTRKSYTVSESKCRVLRVQKRKNVLGYTPIEVQQITGASDNEPIRGLPDHAGGEPSSDRGPEQV